jgi:hypothetical protein
MRSTFLRTLWFACLAFITLFMIEFFVEWHRLGQPGMDALGWQVDESTQGTFPATNTKLVDLLSPVARAYNNILAMLVAFIGLAIPLTANMHTPKLIDVFLRDRVNQVMLFLFAFGAANDLFVDYIIGPRFAPMWAIRFAVYGALFGWAAAIPYFFYVMRFLDPSRVIQKLRAETERVLDRVRAKALDTELAQDIVHDRLFQIGTIVLKSLDRADRGVALEGVWSLKTLIDYHGKIRQEMPDAWFKVDRHDFVGLSAEAIDILNKDRTWFEQKAMTQLFFAYTQALSKTSDVVSSISDAVRVTAENEAKRGDEKSLALAIRFFNNFVREAIKRKDVHSMYDVFYEYRLLARDLADHPDRQREIGRYFLHYARQAKQNGATFIEQLGAFELGYMARHAYEVGSPAAPDLFADALLVPHLEDGKIVPLVLKAKLMMGGYFLQHSMPDEAEVVRKHLGGISKDVLQQAEKDLLAAERCFFEVTDRQENIEYVRPERRPFLKTFVEKLVAAGATS